MKRLDARTVELTAAEEQADDWFNLSLDKGRTLPVAACFALNRMRMELGWPTDEFIEYLSDGTCRRWGQRVLIKPEWRQP